MLAVIGLLGCSSEQDRVEQALEQAFADSLIGCAPVAWKRTQELPKRRRPTCHVGGRWQDSIPLILDALSHAGRVRVDAAEASDRDPRRVLFAKEVGLYDSEYELVSGVPIVTIEATHSTTVAVCWGDAQVRIVDIGQDRLWEWDSVYDVAAAAGIDTLGLARLRKPDLRIDVWYTLDIIARPWAARLEPQHLDTLRRYGFKAPSAESVPYLVGENGEESLYVRKAIGTLRTDAWTFRRGPGYSKIGDMSDRRVIRGISE